MQKTPEEFTFRSILRRVAGPSSFIFAMPLLGVLIANHGLSSQDQAVVDQIRALLRDDSELTPQQREEETTFVRTHPASAVCMNPDSAPADYVRFVEPICGDVQQFTWTKRVAWFTLILGLLSVFVATFSGLAGARQKGREYFWFMVGWQTLRNGGTAILILQTVLATWLSFWITALFLHVYMLKLILVVAFAGLFAAGAAVKAIFHKPTMEFPLEGEVLPESRAPRLFLRIKELCASLDTAPPKQIIAGIDDNFFVTENPIELKDERLHGRSLFISLSLLRVMDQTEADAVLAHEMAHFSGGDTEFSKKLLPELLRSDAYLKALGNQIPALPVFMLLAAFRAFFELTFSRRQREREIEADTTAARLTSPKAVAHALIRVNAYSSYRTRVENDLFEHNQEHASIGIQDRVLSGFSNYARSSQLREDLPNTISPHPFDSHPPLSERIQAVGVAINPEEYERVLAAPVTSTWHDAIEQCGEIENRQWKPYEERFARAHEYKRASCCTPSTPEEEALVTKHFPAQVFQDKSGTRFALTFADIQVPHRETPLQFTDVAQVNLSEAVSGTQNLVLFYNDSGTEQSLKINVLRFGDPQTFVTEMFRYWDRTLCARNYAKETTLMPESPQGA